ncbi:MAG: dTDP-4-dehydrorhamnose reductase [Armatimonadetes bacterium]|nr:dTDP-4-dehydrorhamnose reductase [Armatimonadota bacterium]
MRILITGAAGMLGTDARRILAEQGHTLLSTDVGPAATGTIAPLDITDIHALRAVFGEFRPDVVLHGAAYTNVDGCERDPDTAHRVNALGTWAVAGAAEEVGSALVAISTDFVFDGQKGDRYTEFDAPSPVSHYGASKLAGENLARHACHRTYIVRTSWLYGVHGKNFPYTMLALAKTKPELPVVADQIGTPTYTVDLVNTISEIIEAPLYGVYHVSNGGECSWADFARAVLQKTGLGHVPVRGITSDEYAEMFKSPTRRPPYSVMRHYALELMGRDDLRPWDAALDDFLASAREQGKI